MDSHAAITVLCWVLVCATLQGCSANLPNFWTMAPSRSGPSAIVSLTGNVYPTGGFYASLKIGSPEKDFELLVDTGSDITWVECHRPCTGCTQPPDRRYKPNNNFVRCDDPLCRAIPKSKKQKCVKDQDPCPYEAAYAAGGYSRGFLVRDSLSLKLRDRSRLSEHFVFGCGHHQRNLPSNIRGGVLGLGGEPISVNSQLSSRGVMRNVVGHCLSARDGGSLILGDDLVSSSKITRWIPFSPHRSGHYVAEQAELLYDRKHILSQDLRVIFDSGSAYTYFNSDAYKTALEKIEEDLDGTTLEVSKDDPFPKCWKGRNPFQSVDNVKGYFKSFALRFPTRNTQLKLLPRDFLIISQNYNVCLGIQNGSRLFPDELNLIGAISMQDRLVIYDYKKNRIGWASMDCVWPPKAEPVLKVNFTDDTGPVLS